MANSVKSLKITGILLKLIEKIFSINFEIKGEENIPKDKSILFCANHFTRFETFVIPFILNQIKGLKYTRSLAYKDLFFGKFGEYLESIKVLSTAAENRNQIIITDLIDKKYNWLIYPEGEMMKSKEIFTSKPSLFKRQKFLKVSAKTGASVLAMKAEMQNTVKGEIVICPITISYRPIHAKRSKMYSIIKRFINKPSLSKRIKEEMYFESSLLSYSKILIEFGTPINIADYIDQNSKIIKFTPLSQEKKEDLTLEYLRYPLTNKLMHQIYIKTPLTFDHFLSFVIYSLLEANITQISILHLKELTFAYISSAILFNHNTCNERFRISNSVNSWSISKLILSDEKFDIFNAALEELKTKKLAIVFDDSLHFNKETLLKDWDFHEIRLQNLFKVLYNEISYFKKIIYYNKNILLKSLETLKFENGMLLKNLMELDYKNDREKAGENAKPENIGMPFYLKGSNEYSVLLCHGYKASPPEVAEIGEFLNKKGATVYGLRLKGHGTTPEDMKTCTAEDWLCSYRIGYEILFRTQKKVFLCGFSMGGLLTLIQSTKLQNNGIISISAPLKVADFKFHFTSIAKKLSEILETFGTHIKDFVETIPENPDTNYSKHYFASMVELKKLMKMAENSLSSVSSPALIIQGAEDKTVDPSSGINIYKKINTQEKELYEPKLGENHVIVRGQNSEKISLKIYNFIFTKITIKKPKNFFNIFSKIK